MAELTDGFNHLNKMGWGGNKDRKSLYLEIQSQHSRPCWNPHIL